MHNHCSRTGCSSSTRALRPKSMSSVLFRRSCVLHETKDKIAVAIIRDLHDAYTLVIERALELILLDS